MNKLICVGVLGSEPDIISNGCKLNLAIKTNNKQSTLWISVLVFGQLSENVIKYKKKGDRIFIDGKLEESKTGGLVVIAQDVGFL